MHNLQFQDFDMPKLFPRGIAVGDAFYDRIDEQKKLKRNLDNCIHTVLIAPRRFGKTSLMMQMIHEHNYPNIWLDFMTITSIEELRQKLMDKISHLIVQIAPAEEKLKQIVKKYFLKLKPELVFSVPGLSLKLQPSSDTNQDIVDALIDLDKILQENKKMALIALDEFQEIVRLESKNAVLQASFRHAAERASAITYFFSGSKHRPLKKLFNGKTSPLYELCDQLQLERVSKADYKEFINNAAIKKWGYPFNDNIIDKICNATNRYPKYINALCNLIWVSDAEPSIELVETLWKEYLYSRKTDIIEEIKALTLNQLRLLKAIAENPVGSVYSKEFLAKVNLSQSSVQNALEILLDDGLIIELEDKYHVLDPTLIAYFNMH